MRFVLSLLASMALFLPITAFASDGNSRVSVGYTHYEPDGGEDLGLVTVRYTYNFRKYFGMEFEVSNGVTETRVEDDESDAFADISAGLGYAGFGTARLPFGNFGSDVFVKAGYASVELEDNNSGLSTNVDGYAFGVGTNLMMNHHHGVRLDYTRIEGEDDFTADQASLSYVFRF